MKTAADSLSFSDTAAGKNRHICAFFNSVDEQHRVLRSFIRDGFADRDKAYHYVDPERWEEHLSWLADTGINVAEAMDSGQLEVQRWQDSTLRGGCFDLDSWLSTFEQVLQSGSASGYGQTRFLGHMEWALANLPGTDDLIEYETRVNYVIPKYKDTVVCTYDLTKFGASAAVNALRTHPVVIIGGLLQENPFYVSPDQLLLEIRERRSARRNTGTADLMAADADADAETLGLRSALRDLVALSAMSALWVSTEPAAVAAGLAEVLTALLRLDFVFVRLRVPGVTGVVEATHGTAWRTFPEWLERHLAEGGLSGKEIVPDVDGGVSQYRGVVIPIGMGAEGGVIGAACDRDDFPTAVDQLLLSVAANHAAAAFQSARLKEQRAQMWFLENLDRIDRAIQGTSDLDGMTGGVLDVALATFGCDRTWLVYPCDPDAFRPGAPGIHHLVRAERIRPESSGACGAAAEIPDIPEVANISRIALAADGPVRFGPESDQEVPPQLAERFSTKSMIAMAVYPKVDKPYLFGLHQCSTARVWTLQEERLFHEIGRRLGDALGMQLMFRNLRDSERKLEQSRAELAASRARIVTAADDTRRRIERDLHDGVQQRLVSLVLAQRTAQALVPAELGNELRRQLSEVADGLAGALEELQEISRGIHPAILSQGGLAHALRSLARRSAVPVELEVNTETRLPEPVEVAAYYVVSEALTNAAKHARAAAVRVAVEVRDGRLELSIRDDGRGGADPALGSGLIGLTDRVDALGGTIDVASPPGQGTALHVTLPVEAAWPRGPGNGIPANR
jgi:signal transduction histidine kinase